MNSVKSLLLLNLLLHGDSRFDDNKNKVILEATTSYIKSPKRFFGSHFE